MTEVTMIVPGTGARAVEPLNMTSGDRMMRRGAQRLIGSSLILAAAGLWFAPGASWESDVMLFKLALSLAAVLSGLALMNASARPTAPELEVDAIRRELRLVRPITGAKATSILLKRCRFRDLTRAECKGNILRFWDKRGSLMAEVTATDPATLGYIINGLRDEGKLA